MKKKILISTGGTGGHVIPAITFYEHFQNNFEVFLSSDARGAKYINSEKYKLEIIKAPRLSVHFIKFPFTLIMLIISIIKSLIFLKRNNIEILLATGGYMSVPVCVAAKILNLKIYLFEPNMVIGRANKYLLNFSSKIICYSNKIINFPISKISKIVVVDRILRKEIYSFKDHINEDIKKKVNLLVIGGSQGASLFDEQLKSTIINISKKYEVMVYHQVSNLNKSFLENFYKKNHINCELFNFEENIFKYINNANIAITRAGASTLSELAFLKVPFIAIPYTYATDNHQLENALNFSKNDCCWILRNEEFNTDKLTSLLVKIIDNEDYYLKIRNNLEKFCYQNTWNNINEKLVKLLNEN